MVRNELGKTFLKEVTREIRHLIIRGLMRETCWRNVPRNNRNFLGEMEMMLKNVGVELEKGERMLDKVFNSGNVENPRWGEDWARTCLPAGHAEGWKALENMGCLLSFGRETRRAAVSAAHTLKSLALVSFSKSPLSCQLLKDKDCVLIVFVPPLQNLALFDTQ